MSESDLLRGVSRVDSTLSRFMLGSRQGKTETPFLMPDDSGTGSGGQPSREGPTLARSYDLARQSSGAPDPSRPQQPTVSSSRAAAGTPQARQASPARASAPGGKPAPTGEKAAATPECHSLKGMERSTDALSSKPVHANNQRLAKHQQDAGMLVADQARDMKNPLLQSRINLRQTAKWGTVERGAEPAQQARAQFTVGDEQKQQRKPQERERKTDTQKLVSALPIQDGSAGRVAVLPHDIRPCSAPVEVPDQILQQMDRAQQTDQGTVQLSLQTPDGKPLDLRLTWRGGRVIARFNSRNPELCSELEAGWGQLVRQAGEKGLTLEPPQFEGADETPFAAASHNRIA